MSREQVKIMLLTEMICGVVITFIFHENNTVVGLSTLGIMIAFITGFTEADHEIR